MLLYPILLLGATAVLAAPTCTSAAGNNTVTLYLSPSTIAGLQLALYLENLEVNLFQSASANITSGDVAQGISNATLDAISVAAQQEQVHQTTLQNILLAAGASVIPECQYVFPSRNTSEFLSLGRSLSSVGIGAILALAETVAILDSNLVSGIASIAATEARHDAFFNVANGQLPNPAPFDTPISSTWAYNLALEFIVPASCPVELPIPILPTLSTQATLQSNQTSMKFSWDPTQKPVIQESGKDLFIGWVNQLGSPVYTPLKSIGNGSGTATVPSGLKGVVYAALTTQNTLVSIDDLTGATLAGPVIVLVD
ncbi:ferritin-like domain-containing protein [Halenospora varia]|nr:ferritin-like domain-containing protein [Halenospora varia]